MLQIYKAHLLVQKFSPIGNGTTEYKRNEVSFFFFFFGGKSKKKLLYIELKLLETWKC